MEPWGIEAFEMGVDVYVFVFVRTEDDRTDGGWEYVTEAGKGEVGKDLSVDLSAERDRE